MKPLSKVHQEAIIKAKNETDQNKAAAMAMIETPLEMIKAIMLKHELAVIEVMRELHESREAAVRAEREKGTAYKELMDATAKDADRAYELLRRAETEMRYAGWNRLLTDNYARKDIYDDIKEFLK